MATKTSFLFYFSQKSRIFDILRYYASFVTGAVAGAHASQSNKMEAEDPEVANSPPEKKVKVCNDIDESLNGNNSSNIEDNLNLNNEDEEKSEELETETATFLTEKDVGISAFVSKVSEGLQGIIKQRYSDFLVSEIDKTGNIVKLTDFNLPKEEKAFSATLDPKIVDQLTQLSEDPADKSVIIEVEIMDKEQRRGVHEAVRNFHGCLESSTEEKDGKKVIIVKKSKPGNRHRQSWPASRGNYTHFTMYKENMDTMDAINMLGRVLHMRPDVFTYAGVKDKRAKTAQRVSVYRVEARKLLNLNQRMKNVMLGNFAYKSTALALGDLNGNHFKMIIRDVKNQGIDLDSAMSSLKENGFLNYYGMQRFGTTTIPTHRIGRALLKKDWQLAVDLILNPRAGENATYSEYRHVWAKTRDAEQALKVLKRKNSVEGRLLAGLSKHGIKDLVSAISMIPRNVRLMYLHSYQSYVWNLVLSRRIQKYGLQVIEGDLVSDDNSGTKKQDKPVFVTAADLESKRLQVSNVVLPLPGHDVMYPKNEIASWYEEILQSDDLELSNLKHSIKQYSLSGAYRAIIVRPTNVSYALLPYDDNEAALLLSDVDIINKIPDPEPVAGGRYEALKLEFSLPSSCYATMALREFMRVDTSAAFQAKLTSKLCTLQNEN